MTPFGASLSLSLSVTRTLLGVCLLTSDDAGTHLIYRTLTHPPPAFASSASSAGPVVEAVEGVEQRKEGARMVLSESDRLNEDMWGIQESEFIRLLSLSLSLSTSISTSTSTACEASSSSLYFAAPCGTALLDVSVDTTRALSFPIALPSSSHHELHSFTVVFVLHSAAELVSNSQALSHAYEKALEKFSRALEAEQRRCSFVSAECSHIQSIKESAKEQSMNSKQIDEVIVQKSLLARHIQHLFVRCRAVERRLMGRVDGPHATYSIPLNDDTCAKSRESRPDVEEAENNANNGSQFHVEIFVNNHLRVAFTLFTPILNDIRPYQTLLLTSPVETLLNSLPQDASPGLSSLIARLNPRRSLLAIAGELSLPLSLLLSLAEHLVQWGKARVIDAINEHQVFVPQIAYVNAEKSAQFKRAFPNLTLAFMLASLLPPKPLRTHLARFSTESKEHFISQIVFALERNVVIQLHTFVFSITRYSNPVIKLDLPERWTDTQWLNFIAERWGDGKTSFAEIAWQLRTYVNHKRLEHILALDPQRLVVTVRE